MKYPIAHALALLAAAVPAFGQTRAGAARPDPLDAQAVVPAAVHKPALAQYRRLRDEPPAAWREANDKVHGIGGWRVYAREAQSGSSPASSASAPGKP